MFPSSFSIICILSIAITSISGLNLKMSTTAPKLRAVLWDVDGTLSNSYLLGYQSTNIVFKNNGIPEIAEDVYHLGTKYTTPRRLAWHSTGDPDHESGLALGKQFDELYVDLVSMETAAFYDGISTTLRTISKTHPTLRQGALSNACGAYVQAVLKVNKVTDFVVGEG
jgi:phosphoglycolate phosphatase-like HAD superfamily hydrolase